MSDSIDINCDLGEGFPNDGELMKYISSANIACGVHAGDPNTMKRTIERALENGVAIGAHPSYPDRENFGRSEVQMSADDVERFVLEQITVLSEIARSLGQELRHVKPHGALYNRSARDARLARAVSRAVFSFNENLVLYGLSASESIKEATAIGLRTASEAFADRTYLSDGSLTPRSHSNALIDNDDDAVAQALGLVRNERVTSVTEDIVYVKCDTICIHGDGEHAVSFARKIRRAFEKEGIEISPPFA